MEGITQAQIKLLQNFADKEGTPSNTRQYILRAIQQVRWLQEFLHMHEKDLLTDETKLR